MTHFDRDYSGMTPSKKRAAAVKDAKWFMGDSQFEKVLGFIYDRTIQSEEQLGNVMGLFCGITGYPVKAIWETYGAPINVDADACAG